MSRTVLGLFHLPWPEGMEARVPPTRPLGLYRKAVWLKSNPRDPGYMARLFAERYPEGRMATAPVHDSEIRDADVVVLLYPDAIGLGWTDLEDQVARAKRPVCEVRVLNGRKRDFVFSREARAALRWRRFLEWTMLPELLAMAAFVVTTPVLLALDWARGRK